MYDAERERNRTTSQLNENTLTAYTANLFLLYMPLTFRFEELKIAQRVEVITKCNKRRKVGGRGHGPTQACPGQAC